MNNLKDYNILGVINRTPNSFSDQGISLNKEHFLKQITHHLTYKSLILDIGFESTAPMNEAISFDEEMRRFDEFMELVKSFDFSGKFLSFDTYRPQSFLAMLKKVQKFHPHAKFIFNDISGVLDDELKETLKEVLKIIDQKKFFYVYNFTNIPRRSQSVKHMSFLNDSQSIISQCLDSMRGAHRWFSELDMPGLSNQLILDPGFGFSKTYEQNWDLINDFSLLDRLLAQSGISNSILIGVSKKSFLRKYLGVSDVMLTETLHRQILEKMHSTTRRHLLFRVHNPEIARF